MGHWVVSAEPDFVAEGILLQGFQQAVSQVRVVVMVWPKPYHHPEIIILSSKSYIRRLLEARLHAENEEGYDDGSREMSHIQCTKWLLRPYERLPSPLPLQNHPLLRHR